ncbi:MAG TPA: sugar phosphate isomerase/epimerase [Methylomirabilota bacterium]|nr:sugar phosphate isomerase/epimerase [Methylomirabilota bacterium]
MKTSASLFLTDILPHNRKLFHKIVKSKIFDHHPLDEVFSALKKAGLDGIELLLPSYSITTDKILKEVKDVLHEHHMPVLSVHQVLRFFTKTRLAEVERLFEIAQILGAKIIVLHTNSAGKQVFDSEYVDALHSLEKKYAIKIGFENMEKFIGSLHRGHSWHQKKFAELMKKNDFSITFDTTHLAHSGGDIINFFKNNKDRIINIHLSDYKFHILNSNLRPLRYKHLPLGKGELPIGKFLSVLKKEKYNGNVTLEINTDIVGLCQSAGIMHTALRKNNEEQIT